MPEVQPPILLYRPGYAERLMSILLGGSLTVVLVVTKGFGSLLALLFLVSLCFVGSSIRHRLRRQDWWFLLFFNSYPLLVATSMLVHGLGDPALFDNASRFFLLSVVYVASRVKPFDAGLIVVGAMLGTALTFTLCLMHLGQGAEVVQGMEARYVGTENPVVFAQLAFLLLLVATTPTRLPKPFDAQPRGLLIFIVLMASISLVISQSRVVLIALLILYAYLFLVDSRLHTRRLLGFVLVLMGIATVIFLFNASQLVHLRGTAAELLANLHEVDQQTSVGQRLVLWSSSIQLILEKPLSGYGAGHFNEALNSLPGAASFAPMVRGYGHAHNEFLQLAVEYGLTGLAVFLVGIFGILILTLHERFGSAARHLVLGVIGFWLYCGSTQTQLAHQKTTLMFALLVMLGFSLGMNEKYGSLNGRAE